MIRSGCGWMSADDSRDPWDADYTMKGSLFGGAPHPLPSLPDGVRLLELGCGNGKSLSAMVHRDWVVTAIDFSARATRLARTIALQGSGADVAVADARAIPCHNRSFDIVVACHILGHMDTDGRDAIAREIIRVVRPGGCIWFCDFSTRDFRFGSGRETEPATFLRGNGIPTHYFTETEVLGIFPGFVPRSLRHDEWSLKVRGKDYLRSEISAIFQKHVV
jgi:SAM-dependent methyltransferase